MTQAPAPAPAVARREVVPVYAAGFVTAFGAHAVAARASYFISGRHHMSTGPPRPLPRSEGRLGPDDHPIR